MTWFMNKMGKRIDSPGKPGKNRPIAR